MNKIFSTRLVVLFSVCWFVFALANCKESKASDSMSGVFTFMKGTITKNGQVAKLGNVVNEGDVLVSQKRSTAVIQFSSGALITLRGDSEFEVSVLSQSKDGKKNVSLTQKKGSTFSKVISSENMDYSVSAPTLTAGVRGTSFEMNVSKDGGTEIKLLEGKVAISPDEKRVGSKAKELILDSGNKIKVTVSHGISEPQELTSKDKGELASLNKIELVPNPEEAPKMITDSEVIEILSADYKEYTLEDVKKEYGKISKIIAKSGQIYVGNFAQKGKKIMIRTTDGQFSIPASEVKKVSLY